MLFNKPAALVGIMSCYRPQSNYTDSKMEELPRGVPCFCGSLITGWRGSVNGLITVQRKEDLKEKSIMTLTRGCVIAGETEYGS